MAAPPLLSKESVTLLKFIMALFSFLAMDAASSHSLKISTSKATYFIGEPIFLRIENFSDSCKRTNLFYNSYKLNIQFSDTSMDYNPPVVLCGVCSEEDKVSDNLVLISGGRLIFDRPGTAKLVLVGKNGKISNEAELNISSPSSQNDKRALAIIMENPSNYGNALLLESIDGFDENHHIIRRLSAFDNSYRDYAKFVLSMSMSRGKMDYVRNQQLRAPSVDSAMAYSQCENNRMPEYIRIKNALYLDKVIIETEKPNPKFERVLAKLKSEFHGNRSVAFRDLSIESRQKRREEFRKFKEGAALRAKNRERMDSLVRKRREE